MRRKVTDAEFEVVSGPYRVGDEHRVHRGWFFTGHYDRHGIVQWYKPPGPVWRWIRRVLWIVYAVIMLIGISVGWIYG